MHLLVPHFLDFIYCILFSFASHPPSFWIWWKCLQSFFHITVWFYVVLALFPSTASEELVLALHLLSWLLWSEVGPHTKPNKLRGEQMAGPTDSEGNDPNLRG